MNEFEKQVYENVCSGLGIIPDVIPDTRKPQGEPSDNIDWDNENEEEE